MRQLALAELRNQARLAYSEELLRLQGHACHACSLSSVRCLQPVQSASRVRKRRGSHVRRVQQLFLGESPPSARE